MGALEKEQRGFSACLGAGGQLGGSQGKKQGRSL